MSVYAAINPDGYASQYTMLYKAVKFQKEQTIELVDSFAVRSVSLDFPRKDLDYFKQKVFLSYDSTFTIPKSETALILKIEILETYPGSKYDDVCISELFFNDCFIAPQSQTANPIEKLYLNDAENALLLDDGVQQGALIYTDPSSVLQILEVSDNKKWAILLAMPAEIEGRAETTYLLFDLANKAMLNKQLEKYAGNYLAGNEIYFETDENGRIYLSYFAKDGDFIK